MTEPADTIHGTVAEGFEGVREEFAAFLAEQPSDPGAQLVAWHDGRQVVDLWSTGGGVTGDSLTGLYSITKGAAHLVVALLVQDGVLELDRVVTHYWPEFPIAGLTLRDLLAHRSGLIGVDGGFTDEELADDRVLAKRLERQKPFWEPGEGYGYHACVIGALTGEVVRRATGRSIQEIFEERIRAPYGLSFYLGFPEELEPSYVDALPILDPPPMDDMPPPSPLMGIAFNFHADPPTDLVALVNQRRVRELGPASIGGVGNARGVAKMYAAAIGAVDGKAPLLEPATIAEFGRVHTTGPDLVVGDQDHFALGFEAQSVRYPFLGEGAFGHCGAAGHDAFADPRNGLAYTYVRRRFAFPGGPAAENQRLGAAVLTATRE